MKRPMTCAECHDPIARDDSKAGFGLCGACLHDAIRSGWVAS